MTLNLALANITPTGLGSPPTRLLGDRYHEIVNVKDYGATGDGVTDDWAAIMAAFNHDQVRLTVTGTNQTASFTGQQCYATFNGTCSGNTLTINSGLVGTVVAGQTLVTSAGNRVIASGSGTSWTFSGATLAVSGAMSTNAVLVVSALSSGTISTNDTVIGAGVYAYASFIGTISGTTLTINSGLVGTVMIGQAIFGAGIPTNPFTQITAGSGSTWTVTLGNAEIHDTGPVPIQAWFTQQILGQQTGTTGGNGVYVMLNPINVGPVSMITVNKTITFASVPAGLAGRYMEDLTTASAFNLVDPPRVGFSNTSTTVTYGNSITWGLVNIGDTITFNLANKGVIYFPRGVYIVSQPIDFSNPNLFNVIFKGNLGETSVVGNFPDYVFRRGLPTTTGQDGLFAVEGFSITNNNANGGGVRIGLSAKRGYVSDCTVIANRGINTASDDLVQGVASQEIAINNCYLNPGTNTAGSVGIMSVSDGPIVNCHIVGYDKGIVTWGQQGDMIIVGGTIELCGYGIQPGMKPGGLGDAGFSMRVSGVWFKNCGTAINCSNGSTGGCTFDGIVIDAAEGTIAGNPQYGMRLDGVGGSFFNGIRVNGQYAQYAIEILGGGGAEDNWMVGVQAFNTSSLVRPPWSLPPTAGTFHFVNCNVPTTAFPMATLPARTAGINTINWASGTTTLQVFDNISGFGNISVTVSGISPAGFNGTFTSATYPSFDTVSYPQSNPGAGTGTGSGAAVINKKPGNTPDTAIEGDCYNVNNSDVSTWGGTPSATAGSVHAKVRWNGSNWTVIGV